MPRLSKPQLLQVVAAAVSSAGWRLLYLGQEHPFRLKVYSAAESYTVRIYIWNITHGGGAARPASEYRIQVTGFDQFEPEPGGQTLILGWWSEVGVFAGFDFSKHQGPLGSSPSLQIREECLRDAYTDGLSACRKGNDEVAIAFRPEFLVEYIRNLTRLHGFGDSEPDLALLETAARLPDRINDAALQTTTPERRVVVRSVQQRVRSANFRARVLTAYDHACAFCGLQLELIQAAHILPVTQPQSTDETYNGIAACFLHHAAYDRGLITFDETYRVEINDTEIERLAAIERVGELARFRSLLRPLILLPPEVRDRPQIGIVGLANTLRGWY